VDDAVAWTSVDAVGIGGPTFLVCVGC
jgi:hypothetical protein